MERMSATVDYDTFDYKYDAEPLKLEDAVKKAEELRRADPDSFYRVVPTDENLRGFRIQRVPKAEVFVDFFSDAAKKYARFISYLYRFYSWKPLR